MSSEIHCTNDHDTFCFVCGHHAFRMKRQSRGVRKYKVDAPKFVQEYRKSFNQDPLERNTDWSPSEVCSKCYHELTSQTRRIKRILSPMEWLEPENHPQDCFFCRTDIPAGTNKRREDSIRYAFDVPSVKRAIFSLEGDAGDAGDETGDFSDDETEDATGAEGATAYDDEGFPDFSSDDTIAAAAAADSDIDPHASTLARKPVSGSENISEDEPMDIAENVNIGASTPSEASKAPINIRPPRWSHASVASNVSSGSEFHAPRHYTTLQPPKPIKENIELTQERMNDLVRDMNLTKENAEFLASRLKDFGLGDGK